jgi:hypothetical protein
MPERRVEQARQADHAQHRGQHQRARLQRQLDPLQPAQQRDRTPDQCGTDGQPERHAELGHQVHHEVVGVLEVARPAVAQRCQRPRGLELHPADAGERRTADQLDRVHEDAAARPWAHERRRGAQ